MYMTPYQPPPPRQRGCMLVVILAVVFVGLLVVVVVRPTRATASTTDALTTLLTRRTPTPLVVQLVAAPAPGALPDATSDPDVPTGSPLGTRGVVLTQGYGVGSHAPANIWGAVDLAIDGDGDGQADQAGTDGAPIYATQRGTVTITPNSVPAGNHVWVLGTHFKTGYSHLKGFAPGLADGQTVERGTVIGYVGATGHASGPHLDYQVWKDGFNVNPLDYGALPVASHAQFVAPTAGIVAAPPDAVNADDPNVQLVQRAVGSGHLVAIVARLGPATRVAVVAADGAVQDTDATGDTTWADGGSHLRTLPEMAAAPYAQQPGWTLRGGINFGFFGARTSDEGTVVVDGQVRHVNAGRAAVCLTANGDAQIGLFTAEMVKGCAQAFGAGPVVMAGGKIVGADLPFNPLSEDFVQADWREQVYAGTYAKTTIGIGHDDRGTFLVLSVAWDVTGVEIGRALRALGVTDAIGGDDDTSSQLVWNGQARRAGQPVPDMVAVYRRRTERIQQLWRRMGCRCMQCR